MEFIIILAQNSMEQKLRRIIENPFLKQNPFRQHQSFFSVPTSHHTQSFSQPKPNNKYSYLSANLQPEKQPSTPLASSSFKGDPKHLKKTSNPFFRKNLITQNKENDADTFEIVQINLESKDVRITKPQFLRSNGEEVNQNPNMYKNLGYKTPAWNSKNYISLDSRNNSQERQKYGEQEIVTKVNEQISKLCLGHLLSPRFPSVKVIQNKQNTPSGFVPVINYKSSLKNLEQPANSTKRQNIVSRRNSMDFSSHKNLSYRNNPYQSSERRDSESRKPGFKLLEDGTPTEITIKGSKFYRQLVEPLKC